MRQEAIHFAYSGRQHTAVRRIVEFSLSCGDGFSLTVEYRPDVEGCERNLFLIDARADLKHQMGWWDMARWHPYCLRLSELDSLLQFWQRCDDRWPNWAIPMLLLCQFVGLDNSKERDSLAARAEVAYRALGLPPVGVGEQAVPLEIPENSHWDVDDELGWVFTSDDYCCYSMRNRPHVGSEEGAFPFAAFRAMMAQVQGRLKER